MEMDRRKFLSTAAIAGGVAALAGIAGCSPSSEPASSTASDGSASEQAQAGQEKSADIVVVGAGGAGLCAALSADEAGASVILLEATPMTGGATLGSTATNIAGSQMQKDAGVDDSPEQILASYTKDLEDPNIIAMAETYAENNGATYDWLASDMGVKFAEDVLFFPPYPVARIMYPIGGGPGTVQTLTDKLGGTAIELMLETTATELVKEEGAVVGVVAKDAKGAEYRINAKAVILAAGGFGADRDMLPYEPLKNVIYYGAESSDGKGLDMALHAGTMLKDLDNVPIDSGGLETSPGIGTQLFSVMLSTFQNGSGIVVGPDGERVMDETGPSGAQIKAYQTLPDATAYLFMDKASYDVFYTAATREVGGVFSSETWEKWLAKDGEGLPFVVTADTVEDVASKAKIDGANLKATIDSFNADAPTGTDSAFGRSIAAAIGEGPYCIVKLNLRYAHSYGGLVANGELQALDWTGTPIPGLYAAGQMLCSIQGRDAHKPSTGTSFAYTSGRCAGINAAKGL